MGKKILEKLYIILQVIWIVILTVIFCNGLFYFVGLIITQNVDIREWWIIQTDIGKTFLIFIELTILFSFPKIIKETIKK